MPRKRQTKMLEDWTILFQCSKCEEFKRAEDFVKNNKSKRWVANICLECKRAYRNDNKERINFESKIWWHMKNKWLTKEEAIKYLWDWDNRLRKPRQIKKIEGEILYKCNTCFKYLPENKFRRGSRGAAYSCIECEKKKNKVYNLKNRDARNLKTQEWHKKNKEKEKEYYEKYKALWKRNDYAKNYSKGKSEEIWFSRYYFHQKAKEFKKKNKIKFNSCVVCWKAGRIHMHHPSYKSMEMREFIVPVCPKCHINIHNGFLECPEPIKLTDLVNKKTKWFMKKS